MGEVFGFDILSIFTWMNLLAIIFGTFVGMIIGALPGLGAALAIVLLLPLTYAMEPLAAILMLLATYQAAEYGGSISAILLGVPGTPAAAATVLDGNPLGKKAPGKALAYSLYASTIGGIFGGLVLMFLSIPLTSFALSLSAPEFFLIAILGLIGVVGLSSTDATKSLISAVLGLMTATIGMDLISGTSRFTFNRLELMEGVNMVVLLVGLFAFSEFLIMISKDLDTRYKMKPTDLKTKLTLKEFKGVARPISIGSITGSIIGIIPGMGAGPSAWFAYSAARSTSKSQETFGKGNPEGIAAPESANNATVGGALVPLLSLGIPGSPTTAIIMGAFIIHGLQPGPGLLSSESNLVYGIFYGFILTTIAMFVCGKLLTSLFSRVLVVPNPYLIPIVIALSMIGVFTARGLFFDLWFGFVLGIIAFLLRKLDFSIPAFVLAFVLGPIIESSLRQSLILSSGSYSIFFTRLPSLVIIFIIVLIILFSIRSSLKKKKQKIESQQANEG